MAKEDSYRCKRCNKATTSADLICQNCKNELLAFYEATSDWQTAFEIEKAQLTAARYQVDDTDDYDPYYP